MDVCSYCNTPLFAKALEQSTYQMLEEREKQIERPDTSAWSLLAKHGIKNIDPGEAKVIVDYIKSRSTIDAIVKVRAANPTYDATAARNVIGAISVELGIEKAGGCLILLFFIPWFIFASYLAGKIL